MIRKLWPWLLAAALVIGAAGWGFARKPVTLVLDGERRALETYALTVGGLLRLEGISLAQGDRLSPPLDHWLERGQTITLERAAPIQIAADGVVFTILSASHLPADWLAAAGLALSGGDLLFDQDQPVEIDAPLGRAPNGLLQIRRAAAFRLQDGAQTLTLTSTAPTLGQALSEAGIPLYAADRLSPPPETPLTAGLVVTLQRSQALTVTLQGREIPLRSAAATVGAALTEAGLSPQGLDETDPPANSPLPADGRIRLVRVSEQVLSEQTPLPFEVQTQAVDTLELDQQQIVQVGQAGVSVARVRVRYADGQEISRRAEDPWVAIPPSAQIIGYGSKVVLHTLETPDGTITYWRALRFYATSYYPKAAGGSRTASGKPLKKGVAAIDWRYIPYGVQMYVPGYGFAEAADTGGFYGRWIDLGYSDDDYVAWHQWVTVYFLWPPPGFVPLTIPYPITASGYSP